MNSKVRKNYLNRKLSKKVLKEYYIHNLLFKNKILPYSFRGHFLPPESKITKITEICLLSGMTRAVHSEYSLSRISYRNLVDHGYIPGVRRSSW